MDIFLVRTADVSFSDVERYLPLVTKPRQRSVLKKKHDEAKVNALVAELLVLSEITRRTGIPERKIAFTKGSQGKPYLKGSRLQFSLSHTKGAVCAAFSADEEIGIDIERADRKLNERLYARVLSEEERLTVHNGEDFIRAWVQKEAFLKRLGIGITCDLRGVSTTNMPDTATIRFGEYFVGASVKGLSGLSELCVREIPIEELFSAAGNAKIKA
jgi:phosphopantetheinyl transferase